MNDIKERYKVVLRTGIVSIVTNVLLATFKMVVGVLVNSIAIISDGVNNYSDATSGLITIIAAAIAGKEPDSKHPFGHGRAEHLSSLAIGGIIIYAGITALVESVKAIISHEVSEYSTVSLCIVFVAILVKVALSIYTGRMGKKAESDALVASGKDAMMDAVVSSSTLLTAFIFIFTGYSLEAWLAAVISLLIIKAGFEVLRDTVSKILGQPADVSLVINMKKTIASFEEVNGAYDLVINDYGPGRTLASVHIEIDSGYSADYIDRLTRNITDKVLKEHGVYLTAIGIYSKNLTDEEIINLEKSVCDITLSCEMVKSMHGFYVNKEEKEMRFDLVIGLEKGNRKEYHDAAIAKVREKFPEYTINAGIDIDYNELSSVQQ